MSDKKTCFIIMPISDQAGYEDGHFDRVYNHLLKPACEKAGFDPHRADEESKTNFIVIDVIKKILNSDIVLCDLSAKNPNVLYELGIRQAFNKKTVLVKDKGTERVFDIQGLRTIDYDENLRIDCVNFTIENITEALIKTYKSDSNDVNSLIQLLSLEPAKLSESVNLSADTGVILEALKNLYEKVTNLEKNKEVKTVSNKKDSFILHGYPVEIGQTIYYGSNYKPVTLEGFDNNYLFLKDETDNMIRITYGEDLGMLSVAPF